jgi:hypothetical protein
MNTFSFQVDARQARVLRLTLALSLLLLAACGGGYGGGGGGSGMSGAGMMQNMPVIMTQPASQTMAAGSMATFSVKATGATGYALSYQWYKQPMNGTAAAIASATMTSYTTTAVTTADSGSKFFVTVSNSYGTATSSSAVLTVM